MYLSAGRQNAAIDLDTCAHEVMSEPVITGIAERWAGHGVHQLRFALPQLVGGQGGEIDRLDQIVMVHGALPQVAPDHSGFS